MSNLIQFSHNVYDRGDVLDYQVEDVIHRTKVFPYLEKHQLNDIGCFKTLIKIIPNSEIRTILNKIGTPVISWENRVVMIGHESKPFVAEVMVFSAINCLQIGVTYWAHASEEDSVEQLFKDAFKDVVSEVKDSIIMDVDWFYSNKEGVRNHSIRELIYENVHKESYPNLDLDPFMEGFFKSSASVMIISGVPGTGKTKLIRHIVRSAVEKGASFVNKFRLKHRYHDEDEGIGSSADDDDARLISSLRRKGSSEFGKIKVAYTTDVDVLSDDNFYITLRTNNYHFVILEDIDFKLKPRAEDNELMHKFLAMSDGFITTNCKIILTTNLSVGEIDSALVRPGRCYASIETRKLNSKEAEVVLAKLEKPQKLDERKEYSLADLYALAYHLSYSESTGESRMGFRPRR